MDTITFDEFAKIEMRIGKVLAAEVPEGSDKVIKMTVDFGEEVGQRTIFAGVKKWYSAEEMVGKTMPFILNIPPKKIGEMGESQGMALAVIKEEKGERTPVFLVPEHEVPLGSVLK